MLKNQFKKYTVIGLLSGLIVTGAGCANLAEDHPADQAADQISDSRETDQSETEPAFSTDPDADKEEIIIANLKFDRGSDAAAAVFPNTVLDLNLLAELEDGTVVDAREAGVMDQIEFSVDAEWASITNEGRLAVNSDAPAGSEAVITAICEDVQAEAKVVVLYSLGDTIEASANSDLPVVTNASSIAVVVNKQRSLEPNYAPDDLVIPDVEFFIEGNDQKKYLRKPAAEALEQLFAAAKEEGIHLVAVSGYRSYERQKSIFEYNVQTQGEEHARRFSAVPGTSEHQTGLAMDISSREFGNRLEQEFGDTEAGKWVAENCHKFGFIIRYPNGKEDITGYAYEPWHLRYVGVPLAESIAASGLTMEEYFNEAVAAFAGEAAE